VEQDVKNMIKDWLRKGFQVAAFESRSLLDWGDKFYMPLETAETKNLSKGVLVMQPKKMVFLHFIHKVA
jgi:hypothetical protein